VSTRPLEGITVVDFSRVLAGPYCTMVLADLGARVIKIEIPGVGDDSRSYGPFVADESAYFISLNRNKESLTLNLKTTQGLEIARRLCALSDVLVENFRPGTMNRLGLGYDVAKEINPRLIYASISGYGQDGPWKNKPAYDIIIQGVSGIMSITGQPGGLPTKTGMSVADITTGMFAAIGILVALYERDRSGKGQRIDAAMLDCQLAILENAIARYLVTGKVPGPLGTRHPSITPFAAFPSKDGYILVGMGNDSLWKKFCISVGRKELSEDPRFSNNRLRTENWNQLRPILNEIFRKRTTSEWIEFLEDQGIPCGPVNTIDKVVEHPQVKSRNTLVDVPLASTGTLKIPRMPVRMSRTDPCIYNRAPRLGENRESILRELGYSDSDIESFKQNGVI